MQVYLENNIISNSNKFLCQTIVSWSNHYWKFYIQIDWYMDVGLRIPGDQRQITPALPLHLVDVVTVGDGVQSFADASGNIQSFVVRA